MSNTLSQEQKIPTCIGMIVDGNRRWAKERGLPTLEGHRAGYNKLRDVAIWSRDSGVKYVIAYVFSTENWNRAEEEVSYLMKLLYDAFSDHEIKWANEHGIKIRVAGTRERLAPDTVARIARVEEATKTNDKLILVFALNYGGRDEVINAVNTIIEENMRQPITKTDFEKYLWTTGIPDPDMIIRTSGEHRLSNFLMWQSAYAELFFPDFFFPDFTKEKLDALLEEFAARQRRFGQ